ncbi:MAG: TfoX/Sxy family protein [Rhodobacteraceae bacterium]|nr:TfoX/Sxy family protein [Paracoccaceae bacterium]MCB1367580.1 TfoX/Sxy family protein [Paracoccaceae bacterium]
MAYDEGLAQMMRDDLAAVDGIAEKKMFGGIAFMLHGNMLCGVHKGGAMFRVGKANEAAAQAIDGVSDLAFTGRKMGGMVDLGDAGMEDDSTRAALMALALDFVGGLPAR